MVEQVGTVQQHVTHIEQSSTAIQGAQFNGQGLGLTQSSGFEMISLAKAEQARELLGFSIAYGAVKLQVKEAKAELQAELSKLTADQSPQFIYFITLYNIFKDFIGDLQEDKILKNQNRL